MNKPSLLILPGWGSNSTRWQAVKELLEKEKIEVLILDLPGFGSIPSPLKPWGRDDYINWIFQTLKEKKWLKFNVLGHSFGGGLAVKMATNFPENIPRLILCAPAIWQRKTIKTHLFYGLSYIGKKILSLPGLNIFFPLAQKLIYILAGTKNYYLANGVMKETMKKVKGEESLEELLENIKIPTLILWGRKDDILPLKDAYKIHQKIKNSELKIISKAKHSPHRETPEKLSQLIIEFIKS